MIPKLPGEDFLQSWYPILFAIACGVLYGVRSYFKGPQCPSRQLMKEKVVVVTGSNGGIGKEIVRDLAERGAKVILACRDEAKGKEAQDYICQVSRPKVDPEMIPIMKLDLNSMKSIREFVKEFCQKYDKLDVLVNNAGVICHPEGKTEDGFEINLQSNYLGHFLLTNLLLDRLKAAGSARIINTTALAFRFGKINFDDLNFRQQEKFDPREAFSQSKLAVMLFTKQLSKALEGTGVTANVVQPGVVNSPGLKHMPFKQSTFLCFTMGPLFWFLMKTCKDGAQTSIYCSVAKEEDEVSGKYYQDCRMSEIEEPGNDEDVAKKLWDISLKLTGLQK